MRSIQFLMALRRMVDAAFRFTSFTPNASRLSLFPPARIQERPAG
jgi:hypothetical protein